MQDSGLETFVNAGKSAYHAATVVLRRAVQNGWATTSTIRFLTPSTMARIGDQRRRRVAGRVQPERLSGPSDFDQRHTITADAVIQVPVGRGKGVTEHHSEVVGLCHRRMAGGDFGKLSLRQSVDPFGWGRLQRQLRILRVCDSAAGIATAGQRSDLRPNRQPEHFLYTSAVNSFVGQYPGTVGTRGILRGPGMFDTDLAVSKSFRIHDLTVSPSVAKPSMHSTMCSGQPSSTNLSINAPTTFGEITSAGSTSLPARVMQFALRYEF